MVAVAAAGLIGTFANAADTLNRLNVAAIDAQGQPVTGLQSSDFQLQQDGKTQNIAFFRFTGDKPLQTMKPGPPSDPMSIRIAPTPYARDRAPHRPAQRPVDERAMIGEELSRALKTLESSEGLYLYILTSNGELYPVHPLPKPGTEVTPGGEPWTQNIAALLQTALKTVFGFKAIDERDVKVRFDSTMHAMRELGGQMQMVSGRRSLVWVGHGVPLNGVSISEQGRVDLPIR